MQYLNHKETTVVLPWNHGITKETMVIITSQHSLYLIDKLRDRVNILTSNHIVTICALLGGENS